MHTLLSIQIMTVVLRGLLDKMVYNIYVFYLLFSISQNSLNDFGKKKKWRERERVKWNGLKQTDQVLGPCAVWIGALESQIIHFGWTDIHTRCAQGIVRQHCYSLAFFYPFIKIINVSNRCFELSFISISSIQINSHVIFLILSDRNHIKML